MACSHVGLNTFIHSDLIYTYGLILILPLLIQGYLSVDLHF